MSRVTQRNRSPLKRLGTRNTSGVSRNWSQNDSALELSLFEQEMKRLKSLDTSSKDCIRKQKWNIGMLLCRQDHWRVMGADAIMATNYDEAMKYLRKAINVIPQSMQRLIEENYGAPLLSSKLKITEPFTEEALQTFKDTVDFKLLAPVTFDRIYCKCYSTVSACLNIGDNLMVSHRDKALVLFQHACEIGPCAFSQSALLCLHKVLWNMSSLAGAFDFDCFLPLLRLATQWAYTCEEKHLETLQPGELEIRPFNLALKLYADHRVMHQNNPGIRDADSAIRCFLQSERRNEHYSTYHFTDSKGNFREDWYSPNAAYLLAELSTHLSFGKLSNGNVPKLWQQDAQGRTPLYTLVENLQRAHLVEFVRTGLLEHFMQLGACLCACDQVHKMRACHHLDLKLRNAHRVPPLTLKCLAARACRRFFPQKVMDEKLPTMLRLFTRVH